MWDVKSASDRDLVQEWTQTAAHGVGPMSTDLLVEIEAELVKRGVFHV